jgi:hypothetical protein
MDPITLKNKANELASIATLPFMRVLKEELITKLEIRNAKLKYVSLFNNV